MSNTNKPRMHVLEIQGLNTLQTVRGIENMLQGYAESLQRIEAKVSMVQKMASQTESIYIRQAQEQGQRMQSVENLSELRKWLAELDERVALLESKPTVLEGSGNKQGVWMDRNYVAALEKKAKVVMPRARRKK